MIGVGTILLFLAVLSLLVLVHEIGHFVAARKFGCKVEEFGIGFPPRAKAWKRKGIEYSLNWIPLGGFVRIKGESGEHKDESDSFASKPAWKRFIILFAGVAMNFVFAALLLSVGFMIGLPSAIDENLPSGARVSGEAVRIVTVLEGGPAAEAGLQRGDEVAAVNDRVFTNGEEARNYVKELGETPVNLTVKRSDGYHDLEVVPGYLEELEGVGIGVGFLTTGFVRFAPHLAVWHGISTTVLFTKEVAVAFVLILSNLVTGQGVAEEISGPVGIAVMTGEVARLGISYLIQFAAILSINLAILNIFPFPALDGGRIVFLLFEKIKGKPVSERVEGLVHSLGFLFLMGLVVLITYRDFVKFSDEIWGAIKGVFGV